MSSSYPIEDTLKLNINTALMHARATEQTSLRLFSISRTGQCRELDTHGDVSGVDAEALISVVPTQRAWKKALSIPITETTQRSYFVGRQFFNADEPPMCAYQRQPGDAGIAVMAQWESAYTRQARRWRRRISTFAQVEDFCADRLGRDRVIQSIAGAHLVLYFGHGHYFGLDGYHGLTAEHFHPSRPVGIFWSWSCNTLFGRNSFALQLLQAGVVKAYIGSSNPKARSCDNVRLANLSAEVLLKDRPATLLQWLHGISAAIRATNDKQLYAAWSDYHVLGDVTLPLPETIRNSI